MANEAGQGCTDRSSAFFGHTIVSYGAPASQGGSCNKLESYATSVNAAHLFKFNFFTAVGNDLTAIGSAISIAAGDTATKCYSFSAPGDFTAFSVNSGEYLGCYFERNQDYTSSGGSGTWILSGDKSEASGDTFDLDFGTDNLDGLSADIVAVGGAAPTGVLYGPLMGPLGGPI